MHTEESKRRLSIKMKGNKNFLGRKHTEETKKKIGKYIRSEKEIKRSRLLGFSNKGREHTLEVKQQMSNSHKGIGWTDSQREFMSNLMKGNSYTKGVPSWNKGTKGICKAWNKGMRGFLAGKDHPNWQGGITDLRHKIRNSADYKLWRKSIFERDNFTCQFCGIKGGRLEVDHHPKTYSQIIRENKITSFQEALLCGELWRKDKNRTLCIECHKNTPTYLKGHLTDRCASQA